MSDLDPRRYSPAPDVMRDRVVLITGASDGIGRAVALAIAAHGGTVLLAGRTVRRLEAVYDAILAAGGTTPGIAPLDLERAGPAEYHALAEAIGRSYGRLDALLHNAAQFGSRTPIEQFDVPTWNRVLHVNLTASMILTQSCLPWLRRSGDAAILFTTCEMGREPRAYWGAYAVSKHAVQGLAQLLADELSGSAGIRVNCIDPGKVRTRRRLETFPGETGQGLAEPASIVAPYLFLLGPASRGVTGRIVDAQ
jgi:NAD(P)-dependent dehydrogenase (short-subunit alcohol dehydrogenase family)